MNPTEDRAMRASIVRDAMAVEQEQAAALDELEHGPAHRFADPATRSRSARERRGLYTIWDDEGGLVYAGIAGRNPDGKGLANRLRSHASGRRSGDQFCVYVADHYVLPELTPEQVQAIAASQLSMDSLVCEKIQDSFSFRLAAVEDYRTALAVEKW